MTLSGRHLIEQYQECLCYINIYIKVPDVSRRIYKYLFNTKKRRKDLKREVELNFPPLPFGGSSNVDSTVGGMNSNT
jgi:hypothetical protein